MIIEKWTKHLFVGFAVLSALIILAILGLVLLRQLNYSIRSNDQILPYNPKQPQIYWCKIPSSGTPICYTAKVNVK